LEDRPVLAREHGVYETTSAKLDQLDLAQDVRRHTRRHRARARRHGLSIAPRMRWTILSLVTDWASASNDVMMRCRRTSGATALMSSGVTKLRPRRKACA